MEIIKPMYVAEVHNSGGRSGHVKSSDGVLDMPVVMPKALGGGEDGKFTNPEQLFAAGYSACFHGAITASGKILKLNTDGAEVIARVGIGKDETNGGFALNAELNVTLPNLTQAEAQSVVDMAHSRCPYSKATRNNIEVKLTANGL